MRLMLNGEGMEVEVVTLAELVALRVSDPAAPVATAVNGAFVNKARRQEFILSPGDAVELLTPMQGG